MKKMINSPPYLGYASVLVVSLLSACAPNPSVLQDSVYGRYPAVRPPMSTSSVHNVGVPHRKPTVTAVPTPSPQADAVVVPVPDSTAPETPQPTQPLRKYASSPAARALMKQADAEAAEGKLADASATIERALRIEPENPDLWSALSGLNQRQGNAGQAASMASKAQYYQELLN